ncbi:hypothetical protein BJV78DRAFT_1307930, partial [Lactifluus subvellereus]
KKYPPEVYSFIIFSELNIVTSPLDGTILPGVMRPSVLSLLSHHLHTTALPELPTHTRIHTAGRTLTTSDVRAFRSLSSQHTP